MSDHATIQDIYLELALEEVFHGGPDSGLADRILKAATVSAPPAAIPSGPSPEDSAAGPDPAPLLELAAYRPPRPWWRYAIEGAAAACVAGVLLLLLMPGEEAPVTSEDPGIVAHKPSLPQGIIAAPDAEYSSSATGDALTVTAGWYVLSTGAPALVAGEQRVDDVQGRAIVVVGEVPTEAQARANSTFLYQNNISEEQVMNMQWIKAGALALCVISGSAWVDTTLVNAQDRQAKERKEKSPEAYLEQLRKELKELENKLQRVRNMEESDKKQDMIERVENAIKDKKDQIADVEERIAERKRREAEGRDGKDGESRRGKDGADGNAQRRKDAAEKEAAERKAREERERARKAREAEETEEEREARKRREEFEEVAKDAERERERERKEMEEEEKRRKREAEEEEMKARKEREEAERKRKEGERKEGDRKEEKREDTREAKRRKDAEAKEHKEAEERERKEREAEEAAKRKENDRRKEGERRK